jgi:nicotinamidase-related amidase
MQYLDAHPDFGLLAHAKAMGLDDSFRYYSDRLKLIIPNIQRLQGAFRASGLELVHCHIQSLTTSGRDRGDFYKAICIEAPAGSKEAEFIPELAPIGDEVVISKTSSSPFNSSNIDLVLRNLGIRQLFVTGVMTSGCVETTVRDAADRGYDVVLVTDACAARTHDMEVKTQEALVGTFAHLLETREVLDLVEEQPLILSNVMSPSS